MANSELMFVLDVETTGLDPENGYILEVAVEGIDSNLNPVDAGITTPVSYGYKMESVLSLCNDFVTNMHKESGLAQDLLDNSYHLPGIKEVDEEVSNYILSHTRGEYKPIFVGNSMTLDRNFLQAHMPLTYNTFHYRSLDVSSVHEFLTRVEFDKFVVTDENAEVLKPSVGTKHRAMDDVMSCIAQLKAQRSFLNFLYSR